MDLPSVLGMIEITEQELSSSALQFWSLIRIYPQQWTYDSQSLEPCRTWVIGLVGSQALFFDPVEDEFGLAKFTDFGTLTFSGGVTLPLSDFIESLAGSISNSKMGTSDLKSIDTSLVRTPGSVSIQVYLDDERPAPIGWLRVRWPQEAIKLLESGFVSKISLDHDLGSDDIGTGYDVLLWIEEQVALHSFNPPKILIHTANSSARQKMVSGLDSIKRMLLQRVRS